MPFIALSGHLILALQSLFMLSLQLLQGGMTCIDLVLFRLRSTRISRMSCRPKARSMLVGDAQEPVNSKAVLSAALTAQLKQWQRNSISSRWTILQMQSLHPT